MSAFARKPTASSDCGSKTTESGSNRNTISEFFGYLNGCTAPLNIREPESDWQSFTKEWNAWAVAWVWNPCPGKAAGFGSNCRQQNSVRRFGVCKAQGVA